MSERRFSLVPKQEVFADRKMTKAKHKELMRYLRIVTGETNKLLDQPENKEKLDAALSELIIFGSTKVPF